MSKAEQAAILFALRALMRSVNAMPRTKQVEDAMCDAGMLSAYAQAKHAIAAVKL